jgi:hypothetical protein
MVEISLRSFVCSFELSDYLLNAWDRLNATNSSQVNEIYKPMVETECTEVLENPCSSFMLDLLFEVVSGVASTLNQPPKKLLFRK